LFTSSFPARWATSTFENAMPTINSSSPYNSADAWDYARADPSTTLAQADNTSGSPATAPSPSTEPHGDRVTQTALRLPQVALLTPDAKPIVPEGMGTSLLIRKVDVNPASTSTVPINSAQGNPLKLGMSPADVNGTTSSAQHSLGDGLNRSPFISASENAFGAPNFNGKAPANPSSGGLLTPLDLRRAEPFLINTDTVRANGGSVVPTTELLADLDRYAQANAANPSLVARIDQLKQAVSRIEGEALIRGNVPHDAISAPNRQHLGMIRQAEQIWSGAHAQGGTPTEILARAEPQLRALEEGVESSSRMGSMLSRGGKALGVLGAAVTVYDVGRATQQSIEQSRPDPLAAEAVRQVGGWGGALLGAKSGAALGAALGIETGPGAVVTGLIGGIIGGGIGFFTADMAADQIHQN
jgi:hypothetical protein